MSVRPPRSADGCVAGRSLPALVRLAQGSLVSDDDGRWLAVPEAARQLGAEADAARGLALAPALDELEQRAAELEADNHRQREKIARLEADCRELADTLEAARAMNRELMNELNREPRRTHTSTTMSHEN